MSELVQTQSNHAVKAVDMQIGFNKKKFMFILRSSKTHSKGSMPQIIKIASVGTSKLNKTSFSNNSYYKERNKLQLPCPYHLLHEYVKCRTPYDKLDKNFFVFRDGRPVEAKDLRFCLTKSLKMAGFNPKLYTLHATRAGRAGDLLKLEVSIVKIKKLGHWKLNVIFKYLWYM